MAVILADSDVLIDALNGREPQCTVIRGLLESGSLATTVISRFELMSGARSRKAIRAIEELLDEVRVLPLDSRAADQAAQIRRHLEGLGSSIGLADYLIAGICLDRALPLFTRNRSHFEKVPGLVLTDGP